LKLLLGKWQRNEGVPMSIDTTRIHCTGCGFEYFEDHPPVELKCSFGSEIVSYYRTTAWCHACDTIRDAELLPSLQDLEKELLILQGTSWLHLLLPAHRAQIRGTRNMIQWRQARISPPRCLECGSTDISELDFKEVSPVMAVAQRYQHSCGGTLIKDYRYDSGIRINFGMATIWVDQEGNLVKAGN
jgi:predicted Zn-ribbon and HTH transcriptional regulator